ncbi:MAG: 2-phospho-L-lactate guanylyltransferase [Halioglobus sp.]|nr:2-phospho-L-lactate guanylyltransferase [Halioglobus sp.]
MAQALVPLKDLVLAKSRLSGVLTRGERGLLAQAMVEDVLAVLSCHKDIVRITLLSDDPGATSLAQKHGADCWTEKSLGCRGLNPLIQCASERLLATGEAPLIVLHGDLPLLSSEDISAVLESQQKLNGLIVGCDTKGEGTNLLAFNAASTPAFCFGVDSCSQHVASVKSSGIPVRVMQRSGIGLDVDEAVDLRRIMEQLHLSGASSNTAQLLYNTELGARVTRALTSMVDGTASSSPDLFDNVNRGIAR